MSIDCDECYLVIIEDRDGSENYWDYVMRSQVPPLIWKCLTDSNVKYLLQPPKNEAEKDQCDENYNGYTDEDIIQIWEWFSKKSPYSRGRRHPWHTGSLPAPAGKYKYYGVRHLEENPYI